MAILQLEKTLEFQHQAIIQPHPYSSQPEVGMTSIEWDKVIADLTAAQLDAFNLQAKLKRSEEQKGIYEDMIKQKEELLEASIAERDKLQKQVDKAVKDASGKEALGSARAMIWDSITEVIFTF